MNPSLDPSWQKILKRELESPYWQSLADFVDREYADFRCFPPAKDIFLAFDLTPFDNIKVVILGQDPYHTAGAAMGLAFSIPHGTKMQPSLKNIFRELATDIGHECQESDLSDWATQGVLLLNTVLTVREGSPGSHAKKGWENFTDSVIRAISDKKDHVVFLLWGSYAISKSALIDEKKHHIITSAHPSPLSAYRGFFGSKPFSRANEYLLQNERDPIDWIGKAK